MPLSDLTPEQQEAFRARLALAGIDPATVVKRIGPDTHQGPVVLSVNPAESAIKPHMLEIRDVDQMKELAGNKDEHYTNGLMEEHHSVPGGWPEAQNAMSDDDMGPEHRDDIHQAHQVYVYGNSARVASYKDIINKLEYPRTVPVFAAEELEITAENSPFLIKPNESGNVYGIVTIYDGGSIQFEGNVDFQCQKLVQSDLAGPPK
jgi:hypothetical protein